MTARRRAGWFQLGRGDAYEIIFFRRERVLITRAVDGCARHVKEICLIHLTTALRDVHTDCGADDRSVNVVIVSNEFDYNGCARVRADARAV